MNRLTLKALQGSIKKWELIVSGAGVDNGTDNCPLCKRFYLRSSAEIYRCNGCPVSDKTGSWGCSDTPYIEWVRMHEDEKDVIGITHHPLVANTVARKRVARAELAFLKRLLP